MSKKINDPIHGAMEFSDLEIELINSKAFQRLRNIGQLALVSHVFPSATYSRFAHSLGVCHVTGLVIDSIIESMKDANSRKTLQKKKKYYRLAALLHDIGHYPYSHVTEHAERLGREKIYEEEDASNKHSADTVRGHSRAKKRSITKSDKPINHERLGKDILFYDDEIKEILKRYKIKAKQLAFIFNGGSSLDGKGEADLLLDFPYFAIVSSDVDADRMDYLLRNSYFSGLPYGSIDNKYLVRNFMLNNDKHLAINIRALHAVDHFLISRYYDYTQFIYHKTSTGFENMLQVVISYLASRNDNKEKASIRIVYEGDNVGGFIRDYWLNFDDPAVLNIIREAIEIVTKKEEMYENNSQEDDRAEQKKRYRDKQFLHYANCLLWRKPAKMVAGAQFLGDRKEEKHDSIDSLDRVGFSIIKRALIEAVVEVENEYRINGREIYLFVWASDKPYFTSPVSSRTVDMSNLQPKKQKSVKIYDSASNSNALITSYANSLSNMLDSMCLYTLRAYATTDAVKIDQENLSEILARLEHHFNTKFTENFYASRENIIFAVNAHKEYKEGNIDEVKLKWARDRIERHTERMFITQPNENAD